MSWWNCKHMLLLFITYIFVWKSKSFRLLDITGVFFYVYNTCVNHCDVIKEFSVEINSKLKSLLGYEIGWSRDLILWGPKGFSEDLITYQASSYAGELFNIPVINNLYLRFKKGKLFRNTNITVFFFKCLE